MNALDFENWLIAAMRGFAQASEELTALDAEAGDGDLGFTVFAGARAVENALAAAGERASISDVLRVAATSFANGNPSSFAALTASGMLAAARALTGVAPITRADTVAALRAAADVIAKRGRSQLGDRTVLDALEPSIEALRSAKSTATVDLLEAMTVAARDGARKTADMAPRRGRAAWVGERGLGIQDAGAVAYVRLLEALSAAWSFSDEVVNR